MTNLQRTFNIITFFTILAFLMAAGFLMIKILSPDASQFQLHAATDPKDVTSMLSDEQNAMYTGVSIMVDTFFILSFTVLFYGFYLYVKGQDLFLARLALSVGLMTALLDVIEDGFIVTLAMGIPRGYEPDTLLLGILWGIVAAKDIFSYVTTFLFAVLMIFGLNDLPELRMNKLIFAVVLFFYAIIGASSFALPFMIEIRNVGFVLQFPIAAYLFYRTPAGKLEKKLG